MQAITGIYPATVTPFTSDDSIDGDALSRIIEHQLGAGVDGFYVSGSTGEGLLQGVAERVEVVRLLMEQVAGRGRVIVHVGAVTTKDAVALTKEVAVLGVDAISALPPIFYKVPFDAVLAFYQQIAQASALPLLAYYIPGLTGWAFTPDQFDQLLAIDRVIGVKFSDYNLFALQQLRQRRPDAVVMSGNDEVFLPALTMGAHGSIGLTLNFMPKLYVELYRAYQTGDLKKARELQYKANRVITIILHYGAGGISAVKPVMKMIGFDCGEPRGPIPSLDATTLETMHQQLNESGFFSDPIYTAWAAV